MLERKVISWEEEEGMEAAQVSLTVVDAMGVGRIVDVFMDERVQSRLDLLIK